MNHQKSVSRQRQRRRFRVRRNIRGTAERPRLSVFRSHKHMSVQLIDDQAGKTLGFATTSNKEVLGDLPYGGNQTAAKALGKAIAEQALANGIKLVAFDRREYQYHGRVAALAEAAREAGLGF